MAFLKGLAKQPKGKIIGFPFFLSGKNFFPRKGIGHFWLKPKEARPMVFPWPRLWLGKEGPFWKGGRTSSLTRWWSTLVGWPKGGP